MEAREGEIVDVYEYLQETHNICVNSDWLEACISWLKNTNISSTSLLRDQVFEQWLLSDLKESGVPQLPDDVTNIDKITICNTFPLQMNSVLNIGESAYSQLKKLKGEDKVIIEPSQNTYFQKEPPATRTLLMELTDGHQIIQGMEYRPIKCLHTNLIPGCKVLMNGNLVCRKGILFIKENNITILGGHVEHLKQRNTQLNILNKVIGQAHLANHGRPEYEDMMRNLSNPESVGQAIRCDNDVVNDDLDNQYMNHMSDQREQNVQIDEIQANEGLENKENCEYFMNGDIYDDDEELLQLI